MFAKSIQLFLMDGEANGRWACEMSNWSGKAYKNPRTMISSSKDRADLTSTGVYFLIGKGDSLDDKSRIYIGEAENLYSRLKQHLSGKDFWNEAIVFFSKDDALNKAKVKYLENKRHGAAVATTRYEVKNGSTPTMSRISEAEQAELEEFLFNAKMITNILGHKVFEQLIKDDGEDSTTTIFYLRAARGADASGMLVTDGFVVVSGSSAAKEIAPAFAKHNYINLRSRLIDSGILSDQGDHLKFEQDFLFSTPSAAAAIIMGTSANGLKEWKTNSGQMLKNIEQG